jgi:RHS repeat-associated protein
MLTRTDPLGRQTSYTYAADGITLSQVRQTGLVNDVLATYGNFNVRQQPQTVTDAAGQSTSLTYNAAGQVLTLTNAKNETTTYSYDTNGRLSTVTGPVAGATMTYAYDGYGRVRTVTDSDSYSLTTDFDALDRPTRITYPDGSYEQFTYDRLDRVISRDRVGRLTRRYYDALRRLTAIRDPLGRIVAQEWCPCGSLDALIDANGNRTRWERDVQGRVTREVRADNVTDTIYTYGSRSGRLLTVTDPKDQVATYTYATDDQVLSRTFTYAQIPTPTVSFVYDSAYGRITSMQDGAGTTSYTYHPVGAPGAGQLESVDGPLANDVIAYEYDALGRVTTQAINGSVNTMTLEFDPLGRLSAEQNVLGTFTYTYEGLTPRIATITYPNGQTSSYTYFPTDGDHRLQTIHHKYPNGATLSKSDYTYDAAGDILTWRQQADATAVQWEYVYDLAGQLLGATKWSTAALPALLAQYAYSYDPAGNRTTEVVDDEVSGATHDVLNRLVSQQPSGPVVFAGSTNEPATVTIQGRTAVSLPGNAFRGTTTVGVGTTTVPVVATDSSGNIAAREYEIDGAGSPRTFTYDANGNLTADGTRTFEWDARNQLVAVNVGTNRTEFVYDGHGRRVRLTEKVGGSTISVEHLVFCGSRPCEGRDSSGSLVNRRFVTQGAREGTSEYFYVKDHLGSITEVTDYAVSVKARYEFDVWGRRTKVSGTTESPFGFTGHYYHALSGLHLAPYRAYDANLGRWLSSDPTAQALFLPEGPNLFAYVGNKPGMLIDPTGGKGMAARMGGLAGAGAAALLTLLCVKTVERVWTEWKNPYESIDPSQRIKHCIAECEITKNCLGGSATAAVAGWVREAAGDGDQGDKDAGKKGREAAQACPQRTCFLQCEELLKKGAL